MDDLDRMLNDYDVLDTPFPVGKHAGTRLRDLPVDYVRWFVAKYDAEDLTSGRLLDFMDEYIDELRELVEGVQLSQVNADTFEYELSPSQQEAADGIVGALQAGEEFIRLEGGAGYGKSFAVRDIVKRAIRMGWQVKATAVSYVATQVLSTQLECYGVPCMTLARAIGLDKVYDGPKEKYVMGTRSINALEALFGGHVLLVLDEYSMVNDEYAEALAQAARRNRGAILVVGDLKQLPPVNQSTDCSFSTIPSHWTLQDPMRYSRDSDLYKLEQLVRQNPYTSVDKMVDDCDTGRGEIWKWSTGESLLDACKKANIDFPHEDNRILYYRRADVIKANNAVREALYGADPAPLEPGERLLVVRTSDLNETRYYTGTTLDVADVVWHDHAENLFATLLDGKTIPILFAVNENRADPDKPGGAEFNAHLKELADKAKEDEEKGVSRSDAWKDYREYKDSFVFVAYNYATTVHKSQGATVDRVFVSPGGLVNIPQVGDKLAYVALTRAKREVHIS